MLKQRVITAVVLLAVLYVATAWFPPLYFAAFLTAVMFPVLLEWAGFVGLHSWRDKLVYLALSSVLMLLLGWWLSSGSLAAPALDAGALTLLFVAALGFWVFVFSLIRVFPQGESQWQAPWKIAVMGWCCLLPTWAGLIYLKFVDDSGILVFALVALVSVVDIGAYFTGRALGKHKLAPALSPNKTWEGFWGGVASCVVLSIVLLTLMHTLRQPLSPALWILLVSGALLLAAVSVVGDLFESMLKRHRGIKDSGRSLPGHGGILDRIDSLVAATPVFVLASLLSAI